jgi:hypothetical protein
MEQPDGHVAPGQEGWVRRLKKGLYGLVRAGRTWKEGLNTYLESEGLVTTPKDPTAYVKGSWNQEEGFRSRKIMGGRLRQDRNRESAECSSEGNRCQVWYHWAR